MDGAKRHNEFKEITNKEETEEREEDKKKKWLTSSRPEIETKC